MNRTAKFLIVAPVGLILLMWVSFTIKNAAKRELNPAIRAELKSNFVELPDGVVAYNWDGPEGGPILVLVHGFSMPRFVFDLNIEAFTNAGFRVLRFDHYGRGYSDRPNLTYDAQLYDRELLNLLDALNIKKKIHLLGYSMGGGIATIFAGRHPERVEKLILVAPIGFLPEPAGLLALVSLPGLGNWVMALIGEHRLLATVQKQVDAGIAPQYFLVRYKEQMEYRGYTRALLSSVRNFVNTNLRREYETLAARNTPTLLIWGTEDTIVPFAGHKNIQAVVPDVRFTAVEGAGHAIVYSHPEILNRSVLDFLSL